MPEIDLINPDLYNALDPYHHEYDNRPLRNILARQELINSAVDTNTNVLNLAAGTQGTIGNRISQSIDEDGNLILSAVDSVEHSIGAHTDGDYEGTNYVRMLETERDKLTNIASEATDIQIEFETISAISTTFDSGLIKIQPSTSISWDLTSPNIITANTTFPTSAVHNHFYGMTPVHQNTTTPDYTNYKTTSISTVFIEDSLRVIINGIRIPEGSPGVYVYGADGPDGTWTLTYYTPAYASGTFALNRAIDTTDVIRIDFDTEFSS